MNNFGYGLLVVSVLCLVGALVAHFREKYWEGRKGRTPAQVRKADSLGRRKIELALLSTICVLIGGLFAYAGNQPSKDELVAAELKATFPDDTAQLYAVGYAKEDWAQINFRGTVSMIAVRGKGDNVRVGCMVKPSTFTPLTVNKLYTLFTKLNRCPTNVEFVATQ